MEPIRESENITNAVLSSFEKCIRDLDEGNAKFSDFNDFEKYYLPNIPEDLSFEELQELMTHIPTLTYGSGSFFFITDENEPSLNAKQFRSLQALPAVYHEKYDLSHLFENPEIYSYYLVTNKKEFSQQQAFEAMCFFARERFYTAYDLQGDNSYIDNEKIAIFPNENLKNPADYFPTNLLSSEDWNTIFSIDPRIKDIPQAPKTNSFDIKLLLDKLFSIVKKDKNNFKEVDKEIHEFIKNIKDNSNNKEENNEKGSIQFSASYEKCIKDLDEENAKFVDFNAFEKYYLPNIPKDLSFEELQKLMTHIPTSGYGAISSFIVDENEPSHEVKQLRSLQALPTIYHEKYDLSHLFENPEIYSYYLVTNEKEFSQQQAFEAMSFFARERFYTTYTVDDENIDMVAMFPNANLKNPANYFPADFLSIQDWNHFLAFYPKVIDFLPASIVKPNEAKERNIKKPIKKTSNTDTALNTLKPKSKIHRK